MPYRQRQVAAIVVIAVIVVVFGGTIAHVTIGLRPYAGIIAILLLVGWLVGLVVLLLRRRRSTPPTL